MAAKKKAPSWLAVLILIGLGISVSPHQVLPRTSEIARALNPVLSHYEVIRLEPGDIQQQVRTTGELRFRFQETSFHFRLEPHDMRGPHYRAVETGPGGVRRTLPVGPVNTFKGRLAGQEDTQGRFTLTGDGVEGVVFAPEDWYYVEPLRRYLPSAEASELVVYRQSDIKPGQTWRCGVSLPQRLRRGVNEVVAQVEAGAATNYVVEVATEADFEYVQALGGSTEANREIQSIMNQVEGVYQSELLLQLQIVFQHTWATEEDPYTATDGSDLLNELTAHWNTNFEANEDYDLAHMWTGKDLEGIGGIAWLGVACRARSHSYSLSKHLPIVPAQYIVTAHEIGHNFGAEHPDEARPPAVGCTNTIMPSMLTLDTELTFCQFSRKEIGAHVARNNHCLTTQPITLRPPTGLTATAVSSFQIDLTWQDNSDNETGFRVQRRLNDSEDWVEIGRIAANTTTFSNSGLSPGASYRYRMRAFNDTESSAFSNEAAATTLGVSLTGTHWRIDTVAGRRVIDYGPAIAAQLHFPTGVAVDSAGNLYIADLQANRVRRVDASGIITTVAGTGVGGYSGDNGPAVAAQLDFPTGVAVDSAGNLYIADLGNRCIRRVDARGMITTAAGTGVDGFSGDNGPAIQAQLSRTTGVALDNAGNLYIADFDNHRIRRVDARGMITTAAGTGVDGFSGDNGPAVSARLHGPSGVALDNAGNLYFADSYNHRIRRVDTSGTITTVAGTGVGGFSGDNGPAVSARLHGPSGVALDNAGNLYFADSYNHRIRRVGTSGTITTVIGTGVRGFSGDNGPAVQAQLNFPDGMVLDGAGNLYIADSDNHRIRRVDVSGTITTVVGTGVVDGGGDNGPAVEAQLDRPTGMAVDGVGSLYIADTFNHRIRQVDAGGTITTIAGTGEPSFGGGDGGPAPRAPLNGPSSVAVDRAGNLYITDTNNHCIRRVDAATGIITTIAGTSGRFGDDGGDGGPAVKAKLNWPTGVAVDGAGNLYIADTGNHRIRRVDAATGIITTVAGLARGYGWHGVQAVETTLYTPRGLAVDDAGNLYIADSGSHRIRRVDAATGIITTVAGLGVGYGGDGGPAVKAKLNRPTDVAVDGSGSLYIADTDNHRIRRVDATTRTITTIAGTDERGSRRDHGPAAQAELNFPGGVVVDRSVPVSGGNVYLYIADSWNNRILVVTRSSLSTTLQPPTRLRATAVSPYRVNLAWQDNSTNETGFIVRRRVARMADWVEIGRTKANATTFSVGGLKPLTTYHYRVRAFNNTESSYFSNEALAQTLAALPPTVTHFTPTRGPAGTRVTLTGTYLLGATAVFFNGVPAARFEVVSETSIEAVVPPGASSGPIGVITPGGTAVSRETFTVTDTGVHSRLFVPIVLSSRGRTPGSFFTSELSLTNRGTTTAGVKCAYTAAFGGGSGTAVDSLEPGRQRVIPDAIAYLTALGVPIRSGSAGGTLMVDFSNLSFASDAAVTVRVSTPVEEGRAGLAYVGLNPDGLLTGPAFIIGLRQNSKDRSNVALQNAGDSSDGNVTLRATVFSGDSAAPGRSMALPDRTLAPGGFHQYNGILDTAGFDHGYVKIERVSGTAPYYAYGVINDQANSDGSFVFPVTESSLVGKKGQTLPVVVETRAFNSELMVTNFSASARRVHFDFVADAVQTADNTATFSMGLEAGEQRIVPDIVNELRQQGVLGIGPAGSTFAGALFANVADGDMSGIVIGARTGAPGSGGQYGLSYNAVPYGSASIDSAWIYGLQQDAANRSNLALVNTGEFDDSPSEFEVTVYDGARGSEVNVRSVTVGPRRWLQINRILGTVSQGYVHVKQTSGYNPFIAYGVLNDGSIPGQRSGDGAFVPSRP